MLNVTDDLHIHSDSEQLPHADFIMAWPRAEDEPNQSSVLAAAAAQFPGIPSLGCQFTAHLM